MPSKNVEFYTVPIDTDRYGPAIYDVYIAIRNGNSTVSSGLRTLDKKSKSRVLSLISRMATNENYKSDLITWNLKKYNYGELTPHPHRFFFFRKCGNNIIFFDYIKKKKDSLGDAFYKRLDALKRELEDEFKRYIQTA